MIWGQPGYIRFTWAHVSTMTNVETALADLIGLGCWQVPQLVITCVTGAS